MSTSPPPAIRSRRRIHPFAHYLLALGVVTVAYSLYTVLAVPALEGPPVVLKRRATTNAVADRRPERDKSWLKALVPADAWELDSCKTLTTSEGTILFRDYQPLEDGYAEVFPFTLIMNAKASGDGSVDASDSPPVVLRCLKQARLKFDRPLAAGMSDGNLKLQAARLLGQVTVFRAPSEGKNDALRMVTSNVQIDQSQIFTLEQVRFAIGPHHGLGRHLTVELVQADPRLKAQVVKTGFASVEGVRRIELASLSRLRIEPANDMALAGIAENSSEHPVTDAADAESPLFSDAKDPLEVSCQGRFAYDVTEQAATFEDRVTVEQFGVQRDRLKCDQLRLVFHEAAKANSYDSKMGLKSFRATGSPAELVSQSRQFKIVGDQLDYDLTTRWFVASSDQQVQIDNADYQVLAQQVKYQVPEGKAIGPIDVLGPGQLKRPASKDHERLIVSWRKGLTGRNRDGRQFLGIEGDADVRMGTDFQLQSNKLQLWAERVADGGNNESDWLPLRLVAEGAVKIQSTELSGAAQRLTAVWQNAAQSQGVQAKLSRRFGTPGRHRVMRVATQDFSTIIPPAEGSRQRIQPRTARAVWLNNPTVLRALPQVQAVGHTALADDSKPKQHIDFQGDQVDVTLRRVAAKQEIVDLKVDGNVEVLQRSLTDADAQPVAIQGQRLRLTPQAKKLHRMQVSGGLGRLASIDAEGLQLEGQEVFLDQQANRLWVEGPGEVTLTPSATDLRNQRGTAEQPDSTLGPFKSTKELRVAWAGGMIFDGKKIYFESDVAMVSESMADAAGVTAKSRSFSQGLSVALKNEVSFANLSESKAKPQVKISEVVLVDHLAAGKQVFQLAKQNADPKFRLASSGAEGGAKLKTPIVIESQMLDASGRKIEQQTVIAPQATFDADTGAIRSPGPGSIQVHRFGTSDGLGKAPSTGSREKPKQKKLTLTNVKYDGSLQANSISKQMVIAGRVRCLSSPVRSFDEVLDPDQGTEGWGDQTVKLICERVQLAQWNPQTASKPSNEMIATGNAHIVASRFEATADRVSYSQLNDMLVVEGTPRSDANLWFRQTPNAKPDHLVAGKILYRLSDQWTEVQSVRNMDIRAK